MNIETVNELIASLESAGELSIKERKYLELAKAYVDREAESVALALTFEKCREITNCPAGVDLQDHLRQLVADSVQQRISELESPTFTFEVTAEPFTCPRCGTTTTHPEGWHYCHKREAE